MFFTKFQTPGTLDERDTVSRGEGGNSISENIVGGAVDEVSSIRPLSVFELDHEGARLLRVNICRDPFGWGDMFKPREEEVVV